MELTRCRSCCCFVLGGSYFVGCSRVLSSDVVAKCSKTCGGERVMNRTRIQNHSFAGESGLMTPRNDPRKKLSLLFPRINDCPPHQPDTTHLVHAAPLPHHPIQLCSKVSRDI